MAINECGFDIRKSGDQVTIRPLAERKEEMAAYRRRHGSEHESGVWIPETPDIDIGV